MFFLLGVATCHGYVTWNVLLTILFFLFEPTSKYFFNKFILNNFLFLLFSHLSFYLFFYINIALHTIQGELFFSIEMVEFDLYSIFIGLCFVLLLISSRFK